MTKKVSTTTKKVSEKNSPIALIKYLEAKGMKPEILEHKTVYTAIDAANTLKRKIDEIIKSLLVKADKNYYIVCLSANQNLDFEKIKNCVVSSLLQKTKNIRNHLFYQRVY